MTRQQHTRHVVRSNRRQKIGLGALLVRKNLDPGTEVPQESGRKIDEFQIRFRAYRRKCHQFVENCDAVHAATGLW